MPDEARILVTGGAGFIGSHFVRRALGAGWSVVNLDALTYAGNPASLRDVEDDAGYCFHHGNICDAELVARLLAEHQPCALINFAAESHVDRSIERPGDFIETNVVGTQRLLQCAVSYWEGLPEARRSAFRYVQVSTDEVYGSIDEGQASEETRYAPNSPYAASKAAGDHLVRAFHRTYGLPALATCCTNNYGPNQFPEKLIPLTILKARAGEAIPIYGDGLNRRDWIHVFDHCDALLGLIEAGRPGRSYNIGADNELGNLELVEAICDLLEASEPSPRGRQYRDLLTFVPDRPGHDRRYALSSARIKGELDWGPRIAFEAGLKDTVAWYLENQAWIDEVRQRHRRRVSARWLSARRSRDRATAGTGIRPGACPAELRRPC
jgi:dTDP-glucose 4,6-dehydratase